MDTAVAVVQAYLRINGYFTIAEYPILESRTRRDIQMATDIDILAVRFPGAIRKVAGPRGHQVYEALSIPDPELEVPPGRPDMIIGEVKEGRARLNKALRNPEIVGAALARFGCCPPEDIDKSVQDLLNHGRAQTSSGHTVRIVAFASGKSEKKRQIKMIPLQHLTEFLQSYLRAHWPVLRHAQFSDPVLNLLMILEKAKTAAENDAEADDKD